MYLLVVTGAASRQLWCGVARPASALTFADMAYTHAEGGYPETTDEMLEMLSDKVGAEFRNPLLVERPNLGSGKFVAAHWIMPPDGNDEAGSSEDDVPQGGSKVDLVFGVRYNREEPEAKFFIFTNTTSKQVEDICNSDGVPMGALKTVARESVRSPQNLDFSNRSKTQHSTDQIARMLRLYRNGYTSDNEMTTSGGQQYTEADYYHERKGKLTRRLVGSALFGSLALIGAGTIPFILGPVLGYAAWRQLRHLSLLKQRYPQYGGSGQNGPRGFLGAGEKASLLGISGGTSWAAAGLVGAPMTLMAAPALAAGWFGYRLAKHYIRKSSDRWRRHFKAQQAYQQAYEEHALANGISASFIPS